MAKAPYKSPTLFVACPYSSAFGFRKFKNYLLAHYPGTVIFAETNLQTKHLLDILRKHIKKCDLGLFDTSTWNPNVALELGMADGLDTDYFITLNNKQSKNVPSDIQGLQRIEYRTVENGSNSLHEQFQKYIVKQRTFTGKTLWKRLREEDRPDALFTYAIRIICHFRDRGTLRPAETKKLSQGLRLRDNHRKFVLDALREMKFIRTKRLDFVKARDVFKPYNLS